MPHSCLQRCLGEAGRTAAFSAVRQRKKVDADGAAGQAHDGFFSAARSGQVRHLLGAAAEIDDAGVRLKDGRHLPAGLVVFCGGCEWQGTPRFLRGLGLGVPPLALLRTLCRNPRVLCQQAAPAAGCSLYLAVAAIAGRAGLHNKL